MHNLRLAQDAADGLLGEVGDVDLADIPQMEPVRQRLLEKAAAGYEQFLVEEGDDPLVRWGAVRAQVRLGDIQALQGDAPKAETSYRAAAAELESLASQDPSTTDIRRDLARDLQGLGVLLKDANRFQEGEARLRQAIRLREEIAKLADSTTDDKQAEGESRYQLGTLLARRGASTAEDLEAYRAALAVQESLLKQVGDRSEYRTRLARYRNNLAMLQRALGERSEAEATLRATLDSLAPLVEGPHPLPGPRWQFARVSNNLASLLLRKSFDEAGTHLRKAQNLLRTLADEFPTVTQYPLERASVEYNLGLLAANTRQKDQAVGFFKESARLLAELKNRFPGMPAYRMKLAVSQVALSEALAASTPAEAEGSLKKALDEQSALLAEYPGVPEYLTSAGRGHYQLGLLLVKSRPAEAVPEAEKAKGLLKDALMASPNSKLALGYLLDNQILLGQALIAAGRVPDAMAAADEMPSLGPDEPRFYVNAAALLIQCAKAAADSADGRKQAEDCLAHTVGTLRKAVQAKVIRLKGTLDLKDFAPLENRDDFKRLRESLDDTAHIG